LSKDLSHSLDADGWLMNQLVDLNVMARPEKGEGEDEDAEPRGPQLNLLNFFFGEREHTPRPAVQPSRLAHAVPVRGRRALWFSNLCAGMLAGLLDHPEQLEVRTDSRRRTM
jgi:hypothetical protein